MPVIPLRSQRKVYLGGVEQTGMFLNGQKVWAKPLAAVGYRQAVLDTAPQLFNLTPSYPVGGPNIIPDETGNGRAAQMPFGTAGTYAMTGPFGLPFFKGTRTHQAFVPHEAGFGGTSWTMIAFVNPNNETGVSFMFYYSKGNQQALGIENTNLAQASARYGVNNSGASLGNIIPATGWTFTALTFDMATGTGRTYTAIAGADLALRNTNTIAGSLATSTDPVTWNGRNLNGGQGLRGNIGMAGMARWGRALTLAELTTIYNAARSNGV